MRLTKLIYLASPYSVRDSSLTEDQKAVQRAFRYRRITAIAGRLEDKYSYAFILPITMSHNTAKHMTSESGEFTAWAQRDLTYVKACDEIWVTTMDEWDLSLGIQEEVKFAQSNLNHKGKKILVKYLDPHSLDLTRKPYGK